MFTTHALRLFTIAARVALFLHRSRGGMRAQRYAMGTAPGLLALQHLTDQKATA